MAVAQRMIREQNISTVPQYHRRVTRLAAIYTGIVVAALIAIGIIIIRGKFFVTLAQRSNVETLTLAFILALFGYLAVVSLRGAWGALKIVYYNFPAWLGRDRAEVERRKQAALTLRNGKSDAVYLNRLVRRQGHGDTPVRIPLCDDFGDLGMIVIDGAKISYENGPQHSPNSIFAYFEQRIQQLVRARDPEAEVQIVQWATINDEPALQYESLIKFSCNLEKHLQSEPLWPLVELTDADIETLTHEGSLLCPSLRNEAHLPDLEYQAQHTLPIIPEPLAFVSLSREEQRADPVASMGCALLVTLFILGLLVLFIVFPPWVPGK